MDKLRHKAVTILGALIGLFGVLSTPDMLGILPPKVGHLIVVAGGFLAMVGRSVLAPTAAAPEGDKS